MHFRCNPYLRNLTRRRRGSRSRTAFTAHSARLRKPKRKRRMTTAWRFILASFAAALFCFAVSPSAAPALAAPHGDGELKIDVVDKVTGQPLPVRIHLSTGRQTAPTPAAKPRPLRPVKLNLPGSAEFGGHFYVDGSVKLPLRMGPYTFELEASPEYLSQTGQFQIDRHADDAKRIEMARFVDLAKEGWYGGDLDTHRNAKDLPLIMRAEGLSIVPQLPKDVSEDEPLDVDGHLIARIPYAWNLPVWLAGGKLTAIELITRHSLREGVVDNENDGRPRDKTFFPGPRGNGQWSEAVYYHVLNCGLRLPPVAGSGSGDNNNPVGTNRVYVYCGQEFSDTAWWEGLAAGRVFVTNGPLLRPLVQGQPPGASFSTEPGRPLTLEIGLNLATRVPVDYLQIIKNGTVQADIRLAEWKDKKGQLPPLTFDASGWFLVRAVTNNKQAYQFAASGPYFVEQAGRPRISKKSVQFFLDWIDAAEAHLRKLPNLPESRLKGLLAQQEVARKFFHELLIKANAD